jgi:hypothetical protein
MFFFYSVVSVRKAIESLMENDLDMSDLYLSEGEWNKLTRAGVNVINIYGKNSIVGNIVPK